MSEIIGDRWIGHGCGGSQFGRHTDSDTLAAAQKRVDFLAQYNNHLALSGDHGLNGGIEVHPFFHNTVNVEGYKQPLDPLVVHLVQHLNTIPGVKTFVSCQGTRLHCPYVIFTASSMVAVQLVQEMIYDWHQAIKEGWHWNEVAILYYQFRDENGFLFEMDFYDTIALVKFTLEYLGVSLEDQMKMPASTCFITPAEIACVDPAVWEPFLES